MTDVEALPDACAAELAALPEFETLSEVVRAVNGLLGTHRGIRGRYLARLYAAARAQDLSDLLVIRIGTAISRSCDAKVREYERDFDGNPLPPL